MFTATARSIDGTLRNEVDVNGRHTLVTDEPESVGGTNAGPAPHELVLTIHVPEGLDEAQIKRLRRVAEACPVRRAMEAGFSFRETISV